MVPCYPSGSVQVVVISPGSGCPARRRRRGDAALPILRALPCRNRAAVLHVPITRRLRTITRELPVDYPDPVTPCPSLASGPYGRLTGTFTERALRQRYPKPYTRSVTGE